MKKIYDIDFTIPENELTAIIEDHLYDLDNNNGIQAKLSITQKVSKKTRGGNSAIAVIEIESNHSTKNKATIFFEQDTNTKDIICKPRTFKDLNGSFYEHTIDYGNDLSSEEDAWEMLIHSLYVAAMDKKGLFIASGDHTEEKGVVDGKHISVNLCAVDKKGNVYGAKNVNEISLSDDGINRTQFNVNIGDWNKQRKLEDPVFADVLNDSSISTSDKMDYIGKYVIKLKSRGEIETSDFKDIFHQAGLISSGFQDNTLKMIYNLIV